MGLTVKNYRPNKENSTILPESYHEVSKISVGYKYSDKYSEDDDGNVKLDVTRERENIAVISVYVDKECFEKNVPPVEVYILDITEQPITSFEDLFKVSQDQLARYINNLDMEYEVVYD